MNSKTKTTAAKGEAKPALMPKLRFPEFRGEEGWEERTIGQVCKSFSGGTPSTSQKEYYGGSIPFIRSAEIDREETELFLTEEGLKNSAAKLATKGDVLVALYGANSGDVALAKLDGAINQAILCLKSESSNGFVHQFLSLRKNWIITTYLQGGQGNLSGEIVKSILLGFPTSPEQQKIAECLISVDELMAAQARKVDALKTHKKGLMQQLFPREGETQPRLRFPEFQNTGEWAKMTLGQAATFYNGRAYKQEELLEAGKYPVLRVGNFFTSNTWYYSDLELDETKYCENGDLLYAWSASFGPRIWRGEKSIYHYHIWKVIEQRVIDKQFLFITLENETENMKAKTTNGLGIMHITKGAIEGWESTFPTIAEQRRIAGFLTNLDNMIAAEIEKLDSIKTHKDGLMQQLFPSPDAIQS